MSLIELPRTPFATRSRVFDRLKAWSEAFRHRQRLSHQRRTDRLAFQSMLRLDDATLRDIGYSREDVERGNRMPIEVNAALKLQEERVTRMKRGRTSK